MKLLLHSFTVTRVYFRTEVTSVIRDFRLSHVIWSVSFLWHGHHLKPETSTAGWYHSILLNAVTSRCPFRTLIAKSGNACTFLYTLYFSSTLCAKTKYCLWAGTGELQHYSKYRFQLTSTYCTSTKRQRQLHHPLQARGPRAMCFLPAGFTTITLHKYQPWGWGITWLQAAAHP